LPKTLVVSETVGIGVDVKISRLCHKYIKYAF